jgi:hypothetical protein
MKSLIKTVAVAAALVLPAVCFAQAAPQSASQQPADQGDYAQVRAMHRPASFRRW